MLNLKSKEIKSKKVVKIRKKPWEIIINKLGKTKKANKTIDYIYANKNKIVNKEDIANLMNTYFCEVGANLSKNIKQPSKVLCETDYTKDKDNIYATY